MRNIWKRTVGTLCVAAIAILSAGAAAAQELAAEALVEALRKGGHTLYFRHAATDWGNDDRLAGDGSWRSCDPARMRQLSDAGRATARRIGRAIRALEIPIGKVLSSEYCRAAETARLFGLGPVQTTREIMNLRAQDYVGGRDAAVGRARQVLARPPPPGTNVVVVGHGNLMRAATGAYPGEGGSGIFAPAPESNLGFTLVGRLTAQEWIDLGKQLEAGPAN